MKRYLQHSMCLAAVLAMSQWTFGRNSSEAAPQSGDRNAVGVNQQSDRSAQGDATHGAVNPTDSSRTGTDSTGAARAESDASRSDSAMDMDRHFVTHAIEANLAEIEAGKFAEEHAQSIDVKQFAQHMIQEHTQANQQLEQIAKDKNFRVPSQTDEVHQAMLNQMQKMASKVPARQLERAYVYDQVADHVKAVLWYRDAIQELKDQQLRQYASSTYPNLRSHLQDAERLAGMGGEATQAGEHIRGSGSHDLNSGAAGGSGTGDAGTNARHGSGSSSIGGDSGASK